MPEENVYTKVTSILNGMRIQSAIVPPTVSNTQLPVSKKEIRRKRRKGFLSLLRKPFLVYTKKDKEINGVNSNQSTVRGNIELYSQYFTVDTTDDSNTIPGTARS